MSIPANLSYTDEHEWIKVDGNIATIGITDHAQDSLGDLVFVELPEIGKMVEPKGSFAVVESVKAASEVYAPISGEVVEINEALADTPEAINDSPYDKGWIAKVRLTNPAELDDLMNAEKYEKFVSEGL